MAKDAEHEINELFATARELFSADDQRARDAAFRFFRDVWQVNRLWRAIHDPRNPGKDARTAAELLRLHRNTVTNKMRQLGLSVADLKAATSVSELIERSPALREAKHVLKRMCKAERRRSKHLTKSY